MTEPQPPGAALEPLWSDDTMHTRYLVAFYRNPDVHHWGFLSWMRDEYEEELATTAARIQQLEARVSELTETLAFAAQYKGIEGRGCPLCKYEDGVFIERCQMHKDMEALRGQVAELKRILEGNDGNNVD